jgi:hypothetical protein
MAIKVRFEQEAKDALNEASERTGRSHLDLIREAVDQYFGIGVVAPGTEDLVASGLLIPSRTRYRRAINPIMLPPGRSSLDLLDREDRL